jgi:thioredoxin 1
MLIKKKLFIFSGMSDLEELRKKKLQQLQKQYVNGGNIMEKNWPDTPIVLLDADLDENVKKYPTVVVDCWAQWCGPCRMIGPIIEELAREMKGKIVFGKLNVDENPQTSMKYKIMSIPTLLVFKNGALVDRFIGAMPKEMLQEKLKKHQ